MSLYGAKGNKDSQAMHPRKFKDENRARISARLRKIKYDAEYAWYFCDSCNAWHVGKVE